MNAGLASTGTTLDEFLADDGGGTAELLRWIGVGAELFGTLVAIGVVMFLAVVHGGRRAEIATLLRLATASGAVLAVGAALELAGIAQQFDVGIIDALDLEPASSSMLRLLAGAMLLFGLFEDPLDDVAGLGDPDTDGGPVRWRPSAASAFGFTGALLAAASFAFDGHTVTKGPRLIHAAVDVVHVLAGGVWFGGIVALLAIAIVRRRTSPPAGRLAPIVIDFSRLATVALLTVTLAGVVMACFVLDDISDLITTQWGQRLLVKVALVGVAAMIGGFNHFVVVPRLRTDVDDGNVTRRVVTTVTIEAVALGLVVLATLWLLNGTPSASGG